MNFLSRRYMGSQGLVREHETHESASLQLPWEHLSPDGKLKFYLTNQSTFGDYPDLLSAQLRALNANGGWDMIFQTNQLIIDGRPVTTISINAFGGGGWGKNGGFRYYYGGDGVQQFSGPWQASSDINSKLFFSMSELYKFQRINLGATIQLFLNQISNLDFRKPILVKRTWHNHRLAEK